MRRWFTRGAARWTIAVCSAGAFLLGVVHFVINLAQNDSSATFAGDATFCSRTGLAGDSTFSFESYNHPGWYLRHYSYALRVDAYVSGTTFAGDASFTVTSPLA
jgi:hypothetical protein